MRSAVLTLVLFSTFGQLWALYCVTDADCNLGDCCIEYLPFVTRCADKGDDVGDRCGGQFFCDCGPGLHCRPFAPSIWNVFKLGRGRCYSDKGDTRYHEPVLINKPQRTEQ